MHYQRQIVKLQRNSKFTVANPLLNVTAIPIRGKSRILCQLPFFQGLRIWV